MGYTLRKFCLKYNYDPGNLSKMERGFLAPPKDNKTLEKYADILGLEEGSDDWRELFDRASACRHEIPVDILEKDDVVNSLPLFFRTLRGEKLPEDKLREIIKIIRRGG